jgi:Flp pilus assembly protein TadB
VKTVTRQCIVTKSDALCVDTLSPGDTPPVVSAPRADQSVQAGRRPPVGLGLDTAGARGDGGRRRGVGPAPWMSNSRRGLPLALRGSIGLLWLLGVIMFFVAAVLVNWNWLVGDIALVIAGLIALLRDPR